MATSATAVGGAVTTSDILTNSELYEAKARAVGTLPPELLYDVSRTSGNILNDSAIAILHCAVITDGEPMNQGTVKTVTTHSTTSNPLMVDLSNAVVHVEGEVQHKDNAGWVNTSKTELAKYYVTGSIFESIDMTVAGTQINDQQNIVSEQQTHLFEMLNLLKIHTNDPYRNNTEFEYYEFNSNKSDTNSATNPTVLRSSDMLLKQANGLNKTNTGYATMGDDPPIYSQFIVPLHYTYNNYAPLLPVAFDIQYQFKFNSFNRVLSLIGANTATANRVFRLNLKTLRVHVPQYRFAKTIETILTNSYFPMGNTPNTDVIDFKGIRTQHYLREIILTPNQTTVEIPLSTSQNNMILTAFAFAIQRQPNDVDHAHRAFYISGGLSRIDIALSQTSGLYNLSKQAMTFDFQRHYDNSTFRFPNYTTYLDQLKLALSMLDHKEGLSPLLDEHLYFNCKADTQTGNCLFYISLTPNNSSTNNQDRQRLYALNEHRGGTVIVKLSDEGMSATDKAYNFGTQRKILFLEFFTAATSSSLLTPSQQTYNQSLAAIAGIDGTAFYSTHRSSVAGGGG